MLKKTKYYFNLFNEIFSWAFLICMIILALFTTKEFLDSKTSGEEAYIFGYRPIFVKTGSMEPYMMTNSFALTKEITDIAQLKTGDVVSFHLDTQEGNRLRITHRIIAIDNGIIFTKGDNNKVADNYPLTIDNIESKVLSVFNQSSWIIAKWQSSLNGKIFLTSCCAAVILFFMAVKLWIKTYIEEKELEQTDQNNLV